MLTVYICADFPPQKCAYLFDSALLVNNKCITQHYVHLVSVIGDLSCIIMPVSIVFHVVHIYYMLLYVCMIKQYSKDTVWF